MSRIDSALATQVADVSRPPQTQVDAQQQRQQAQVQELQAARSDNPGQPPSPERLLAAAAQLKQVIEVASNRQLDFHVDDTNKILTVQIKDQKTGKLLRQVPSEEILQMQQRIHDLVGMILDKKI